VNNLISQAKPSGDFPPTYRTLYFWGEADRLQKSNKVKEGLLADGSCKRLCPRLSADIPESQSRLIMTRSRRHEIGELQLKANTLNF
jgi:hypothetical protein